MRDAGTAEAYENWKGGRKGNKGGRREGGRLYNINKAERLDRGIRKNHL